MSGYLDKVFGELMQDELQLDVYLVVGLTILFVFGAVGCSLAGVTKESQVKKRAWIITTFSAGFCFLVSIYACNEAPINWDFRLRAVLMGETSLSRFIVHFFRAQAVLDLVLGVIFYRGELNFLTSIVHHTAYFLLCNWMLAHSCSLMFIICCLEELPTMLLGVGHINKKWRQDMPFGITYGILRVALHSFLCFTVMTYPVPDDRLGVIRFNFGLTWFLHTHWFWGWVQQQRRIKSGSDKPTGSGSPMTHPESPSTRRSPSFEMLNISGSVGSRSSSRSSTSSKAKVGLDKIM